MSSMTNKKPELQKKWDGGERIDVHQFLKCFIYHHLSPVTEHITVRHVINIHLRSMNLAENKPIFEENAKMPFDYDACVMIEALIYS